MSAYENVAEVIGSEMDRAWKNIMERLATGGTSVLSNGASITTAQLQEFFSQLGGAQLSVDFACRSPKGVMKKFTAHQVRPEGMQVMGVSGSISIGVNVTF